MKAFVLATLLVVSLTHEAAFAQSPSNRPKNSADDYVDAPQGEEGIISGPFSEYGEFDTAQDEAEDEKFFQYGRFFGIGLGLGLTSATGNAGRLYQGGFPTANLRILYWFDFQVALQVSVENSKHTYDAGTDGPTNVNLFRALFQIKYYFDTRNLSAPITFVAPHLILGGGTYTRTDNLAPTSTRNGGDSVTDQNAFGLNLGVGFELTLKPKKTYLQLEAMGHLVEFADQLDTRFKDFGIADKTGMWFTTNVSVVWTW